MSALPNTGNPMRTDGFEFVEYAAPDPELLRRLFESMGLPAVARHRSKNVTLHSQGDINFIINAEPGSFAQRFAKLHGPSICAIAFRVGDAAQAYRHALDLGAWGFEQVSNVLQARLEEVRRQKDLSTSADFPKAMA